MESIKEQFHIEDYSVSQTTLEQVFLNFARAQRPPREQRSSCTKRCCDCCKFVCCCCCRPSTPPPQQQPMQGVVVVQATPGASGTAAVPQPPAYAASPGAAGYTNVGYVGQQNQEPEVTYQPDNDHVNVRF